MPLLREATHLKPAHGQRIHEHPDQVRLVERGQRTPRGRPSILRSFRRKASAE